MTKSTLNKFCYYKCLFHYSNGIRTLNRMAGRQPFACHRPEQWMGRWGGWFSSNVLKRQRAFSPERYFNHLNLAVLSLIRCVNIKTLMLVDRHISPRQFTVISRWSVHWWHHCFVTVPYGHSWRSGWVNHYYHYYFYYCYYYDCCDPRWFWSFE